MTSRYDHDAIEYASRLIKYNARRLCRRPGFCLSDREDIEQDLWVHLLLRLPQFNPNRGSLKTFIARVIERRVISLIRHRQAERRAPDREECSLNDPVLDADGRVVDRHQTTPEAARDWQRRHDLEHDVASIRDRLRSAAARAVVDALGRGGTINSIVSELGISRRTAERHVAELRRVFGDAGLRDCL